MHKQETQLIPINRAKQAPAIEKLLAAGDIRINGDRPWDVQVHDERFYSAVLRGGSLAFGETYMAKWWDANDVPELISHIVRNQIGKKVRFTPANIALFLQASIGNLGAKSRGTPVALAADLREADGLGTRRADGEQRRDDGNCELDDLHPAPPRHFMW